MIDHNEIVKHLNRIAELKALDGANSFSVSAYQNAAKKIESTKKLDGIGPKTAATIQQFLKTGTSDIYEDLATRVPVECLTMTVVQGIGPKTAYAYWKDGIKNFDELVKAAEAKQLKPKVTKAVLFARDVGTGRIPRAEVHPVATAVVKAIRGIDGIVNAEVCGSFRRGRDTVKDLDIVVAINGYCSLGNDGPIDAQYTVGVFKSIEDTLRSADLLEGVLNDGMVKREFRVKKHSTQIKADVWIVDVSYWGSALNYATGSKFHNIALRDKAAAKGMKINEYGIWNRATGERLGGENETDLYSVLGIEYVEPTARENG